MHPLVFVALLLLSTFTQDAIKTSRVPRVALQKQQQRSWNNRWPARCRFCCCPESLLSHAHGVKTIYTTACIRRPNSALGSSMSILGWLWYKNMVELCLWSQCQLEYDSGRVSPGVSRTADLLGFAYCGYLQSYGKREGIEILGFFFLWDHN